jgi:hypothetical protein
MTKINWDEAPEGAQRCDAALNRPWLKKDKGEKGAVYWWNPIRHGFTHIQRSHATPYRTFAPFPNRTGRGNRAAEGGDREAAECRAGSIRAHS